MKNRRLFTKQQDGDEIRNQRCFLHCKPRTRSHPHPSPSHKAVPWLNCQKKKKKKEENHHIPTKRECANRKTGWVDESEE